MPLDDLTRQALDRALDALRPELETHLRALAEEAARVVSDARVAEAEAAADAALDAALQEADARLTAERHAAKQRQDDLERQIADVRDQAERDAHALQFEAEKEHRAQLTTALDEARRAARQEALDGDRRLLASMGEIEGATTLADALQRLAVCAQREAERVAVLVVKDQRLRGWSLVGFGDIAAKDVSLDPKDDTLPGRAVRSGEAAWWEDGAARSALPPFAGDGRGRLAQALPLAVGGTTVAVLYADAPAPAAGAPEDRWPAALELLARYTSRIVEVMMVAQANGVRLPRAAAS